MAIRCFWLEPTGLHRVWARRFTYSVDKLCPANPGLGHSAMTLMGDYPVERVPRDGSLDHVDSRWPTTCERCGYRFVFEDEWQIHDRDLLRRADTGDLHTTWADDAPVGAIWNAAYLTPHHAGPDGMCLMVRTPGGDWAMDMPSTDGKPWQRTGTIPTITATPSILIPGRYHGWLRNGELIEA